MVTYRMIGCADENGRTYKSRFGTYSKEDGFILSKEAERMSRTQLLWDICHEDCWDLKVEAKKMTKEDIEKELGYKIEIILPDNKNDDSEDIKYVSMKDIINDFMKGL